MTREVDWSSWQGETLAAGTRCDVRIGVGEMYSGAPLHMHAHVWRGREPGPTVFITAAVHGDELNGTGTIRQILLGSPFDLLAGTLLLVPVVNVLGFERHSRYLPDRRDLNRCFPGSAQGSLASRHAHAVFESVVRRCDFGIDLHTAATRRTNFPNVRGDLADPRVAELARSFGAEVIVPGTGPRGSLRRAACRAGCPTILLEAGEVWRVQPTVVESALRGIRNCLSGLGMIDAAPEPPAISLVAQHTHWIRAEAGGFLRFHVGPGEPVLEGDALATSSDLLGRLQHTLHAPHAGIVLGMTTLPSVAPGDPVCHLGAIDRDAALELRRAVQTLPADALRVRVREELAAGIYVESH